MIYTEQNRMFKEATIFSDNLKEDYDIDVSSGDYMFFNTVCIAKITASEDLEVANYKDIEKKIERLKEDLKEIAQKIKTVEEQIKAE